MKEALAIKLPSEVGEGVKSLMVALAQDVRPNNGTEVWPGIAELARRMAVTERTAKRRKAAAIQAGLIRAERRPRRDGSGRTSDLIHLVFLEGDSRFERVDSRGQQVSSRNRTVQEDHLGVQGDELGFSRGRSGRFKVTHVSPEQEESKKVEQEDKKRRRGARQAGT
jgi:hypothetical protein